MTMHDSSKRLTASLFAVICIAYGVSFLLPAVSSRDDPRILYGYEAFLQAMSWPLVWPLWLANPLFWIGCYWFVTGRWRRASILGLWATLLGLSEVVLFPSSFAVKIGYALWIMSMVLLTVFGLGLWRRMVGQRCARSEARVPPPA